MIFIDTNVAIDLRDGLPGATARIDRVGAPAVMSIITRVELEGGVWRVPGSAPRRRAGLDLLLQQVPVVPLTDEDVRTYGRIVETAGLIGGASLTG